MRLRGIPAEEVLAAMPVGVAVTDAAGRVAYMNARLRRMLGMASGARKPRSMARLRAQRCARHDVVIREHAARRGAWEGISVFVGPGGRELVARESVHPLRATAGGPLFLHVVQDRSLAQRVEKLTALAFYDPLTALPNRNLFADRIEKAMARASRSGRSFALLYIDIDGLKAVNDTAGHAAGDALLRSVARSLQQALRRRDTIARLGGDEFVVIAEDVDGRRAAAKVAEKVLGACRGMLPGGAAHPVTASAGISFFPQHAPDADGLLDRADEALYRAKALGRNRYLFAEDVTTGYSVPRTGACAT